jgi:hypothetical protein
MTSMPPLLRLSAHIAAASLLAFSTLVAAPSGCAGEGSGTTGRRVSLEVKIAASPESKEFTNAKGWRVTLTKAAISTGALYFYEGEPLFASRARGWVRSALAHPGHYQPGDARGELLTPSSADLLAGGTLGAGHGVSGPVRSATFAFGVPVRGPLAGELGASVAIVEGKAVKGMETRAFRVELRPEDVQDHGGAPEVQGCPFTPADMQSDGVVTVTVRLTTWLDQVAFDDVPTSADGTPVVVPDGLARNQLVRGAKVGLAYVFSYAPR